MPKARLSQIATTWVDEENSPKKKRVNREKDVREIEEYPKKKQTFNLRVDTIKRLWIERIRTDRPLSEIMDKIIAEHLPLVDLENLSKKEKRKNKNILLESINK